MDVCEVDVFEVEVCEEDVCEVVVVGIILDKDMVCLWRSVVEECGIQLALGLCLQD